MNATDLPARPDIAPAPKKKRSAWAIIASVVGGLIVLGAIGSALDTSETTTPNPITITDPVTDPLSRNEAMDAASPLLDQAADAIGQITETSAISRDVANLNHAADLIDEAAGYFLGVDQIQYGYLTSGADHLRAAALAENAGDWTTATNEMNAFTDDIDSATAAV